MSLFVHCLFAYLAGWLIVNLVAARVLAKLTRTEARVSGLRDEYQNGLAEKIVDEMQRRDHPPVVVAGSAMVSQEKWPEISHPRFAGSRPLGDS